MKPIAFEGRFQIWVYDVSHGVMLLRRNPDERDKRRVDIRFNDVRMLEICTHFDSIRIELTTDESASGLSNLKELAELGYQRYKITTKDWSGMIVAGGVWEYVDEGGIGDPSGIYKPGPIMKRLAAGGYALD